MAAWRAPSTSALRAFEAAARHASFTRAASELGLTQSAISHCVRELETRLGVTLFEREGRNLRLSDAGRRYLPHVSEALGRLREAERVVRGGDRSDRVLTLSVSPSFAAKWLVPRLGRFAAALPGIDLRISANPAHVDFGEGDVDMAVRHGDGAWPHLHCTRLCEERLFPVCSPALLERAAPRTPAQLPEHVLIHHRSSAAWIGWLRTFGVRATARSLHGPVLNEMSLAIDAAIAGNGIALARSALAARDLADGRLARPLSESSAAEFGYWIVAPLETADSARLAAVRAWMLEEAAGDIERVA